MKRRVISSPVTAATCPRARCSTRSRRGQPRVECCTMITAVRDESAIAASRTPAPVDRRGRASPPCLPTSVTRLTPAWRWLSGISNRHSVHWPPASAHVPDVAGHCAIALIFAPPACAARSRSSRRAALRVWSGSISVDVFSDQRNHSAPGRSASCQPPANRRFSDGPTPRLPVAGSHGGSAWQTRIAENSPPGWSRAVAPGRRVNRQREHLAVAPVTLDQQAMRVLVDRLHRRAAASLDHARPHARGVSAADPHVDRRLAVLFQRAEQGRRRASDAGEVDGFAGGQRDARDLAIEDEHRRHSRNLERLAIRQLPSLARARRRVTPSRAPGRDRPTRANRRRMRCARRCRPTSTATENCGRGRCSATDCESF